jgi:hypothetical protein
MKDTSMPQTPDALIDAVEYLRTLLAEKKDRLSRELDYTDKRDAVLSMKDRYPDISDEQLHEVMRRADE